MKRLGAIALCAFAVGIAVAQQEKPDIGGEQVIDHLNQTIAWYQHVTSAQSSMALENVLLQDSVRQSAKHVVRRAFAFARAQAAYLANQKPSANPAETPSGARTLEQSAALAGQRIQRLQARLDELNQQIAKAPARKVQPLIAQRDTLTADLALAKIAQSSLKDMLQFASGTEKGSGLAGQINLLAASGSMPAALSDTVSTANAAANRPAQTTPAIHPETAGLASLVAACLQLVRERDQVDALLAETKKLREQVTALRAPLRAEIREMLRQSDALANSALDETDVEKLGAQRQQVERMSARFKALSGPILPLAEQGIALTSVAGGLAQWRDDIGERLRTALSYLGFRLGTLAAAVIILLIISQIVHRATLRYVRDTRRRRQVVLIRRFVVVVVAGFIILFASVSGIGSFATIAGFVTAGLAVALQNVILSIVAYFFLIGRYGLRTGDRVTVSGLSGQVIEVGFVRFYLMEFAGTGADMHPTGRVAVFSNSVIFQPAALIKQAPGTEYVWHGVTVTFAAETDMEQARKRVGDSVRSVYETYRKVIESQHAAFERAANFQVGEPAPITSARYTDSGVDVTVRYPVEIQETRDVDERVISAVMQEINKTPALKLAAGGYPRILSATQ